MNPASGRDKQPKAASASVSFADLLAEKVVGQAPALKSIAPYIDTARAGLSPEGRPAGIFLLLGPTGTGKTRTVEALAGILHGSEKHLLRVDCGEFQMDHEVAKLIGAPPGYLGHRETQPMLNQQKLEAVTSENCMLSIVLFDEVEKAAPSLTRLLLGVLDKATLRLGDNTSVDFENTLIFLTSNLGAREMMKEIQPDFGFQTALPVESVDLRKRLESIGLGAVRRRFSPEFVNRIDAVITYQPLDQEALAAIVEREVMELERHVKTRLAERCFSIDVSQASREFLLRKGTSSEFGARELKRTIHRHLTQPLATMVASGRIEPGSAVRFDVTADNQSLVIHAGSPTADTAHEHPVILLVDDNRDLLRLFELYLSRGPWTVLTAVSGKEMRQVVSKQKPNAVVLDYLLPDANGVELAVAIQTHHPEVQVIIATGAEVSAKDHARCEEHGFPILRKPFLADELANLIRSRLAGNSAARAV